MRSQGAGRIRGIVASEVPARWLDLLDEIEQTGRRMVLVEGERVLGALISRHDLQRLQKLEAAWREEFLETLDKMQAAFADVPAEEHEREIERAIAEVRAERQAAEDATAKTA